MKLAQLNIAAFAILNEKESLKQEFSEVTFKEKKCRRSAFHSEQIAAVWQHWSCIGPFSFRNHSIFSRRVWER